MKNRSLARGYTVTELIIVIGFLVAFSAVGGCIYVGCHFIGKVW